jgi:hypothetical protein
MNIEVEEVRATQIPFRSFTLLTHGDRSIGPFALPNNIELITFNRPGHLMSTAAVKKMMGYLRQMPTTKRIRSRIVSLDYSDLVPSGYPSSENIRITYFEPSSTAVPNQLLNLSNGSDDLVRNLTGFFATSIGDININTNTKIRGAWEEYDTMLLNNILSGVNTIKYTLQQIIYMLSKHMKDNHPNKRLRLYLMCCRSGEPEEADTNMASGRFSNILRSSRSSASKKNKKRKRSSPSNKGATVKKPKVSTTRRSSRS